MIPRMSRRGAYPAQNAKSLPEAGGRSPLAQLLHALNQPLTGLQCSMEVALATPRTPEQYVVGMRQGLELTGRMRALVEAIREVADGEEEKKEELEKIELKALLREVLDGLEPVAEGKSVCMTLECDAASSLELRAGRPGMANVVFRSLESALSLAVRGSAVRMETGSAGGESWIRIRWHAGPPAAFSRPELGLLVAQAGWERAGAEWKRERTENLETVTVRLPGISSDRV